MVEDRRRPLLDAWERTVHPAGELDEEKCHEYAALILHNLGLREFVEVMRDTAQWHRDAWREAYSLPMIGIQALDTDYTHLIDTLNKCLKDWDS